MPGRLARAFRSLRRERPPREALRGVPADDRLLAWATAEGGATILATRYGLWLPDREERLLAWHRIVKATWRDGMLSLVEAVPVDVPVDTARDAEGRSGDHGRPGGVAVQSQPSRYRLAEPRRLPYTVRQRVERSIGYTAHHQLGPSGGGHVVGRRVAGQDGLAWYLVLDPGTDPHDEAVTQQAGELLARAQAATSAQV